MVKDTIGSITTSYTVINQMANHKRRKPLHCHWRLGLWAVWAWPWHGMTKTTYHKNPQLTARRHRLRSIFAELTHGRLCVSVQYVRFKSCPKLKAIFWPYFYLRMYFFIQQACVCRHFAAVYTHIALWQCKMVAHASLDLVNEKTHPPIKILTVEITQLNSTHLFNQTFHTMQSMF